MAYPIIQVCSREPNKAASRVDGGCDIKDPEQSLGLLSLLTAIVNLS